MTFLFHKNLVEFEGNNYKVKRLEIDNDVKLPNSISSEDAEEIINQMMKNLHLMIQKDLESICLTKHISI